jgi:hemerythrin
MATDLFHWTVDFGIGIREVDEQHKALVDLLNRLHVAIRGDDGSTTPRRILDELADYTGSHFALEESLMRESNYPDLAAHKLIHEDLIGQIRGLQQKLDSDQTAITLELLHFLKVWLMRHINDADKRFGAYFSAAGRAAKCSAQVQAP